MAELRLGMFADIVLDALPEAGVVADAFAFGADGHESAQGFDFFELAAEDLVLGPYFLKLFLNEKALGAQLAEHVDFAAKQVGLDGFEEVVDGARVVALEDGFLFEARGRYEDDGNVLCSIIAAYAFCRLEAVHTIHVYIEDHQSELDAFEDAQGFFAASGHQDVTIGGLEKTSDVA